MRAELSNLKIDTFASRKDWLASRAASDVIGASEAAMALGVSPYGTPWSLFESKRAPGERKRADVLQRGHRWEPSVLAEYEDESLHRVLTPAEAVGASHGSIVILSNARAPWLRETPDAFAIDRATGALGQVEAKTAVQAHRWSPEHGIVIDRWDDSCAEFVPPHIAIQAYVQLTVSELPWIDICALVPRAMWLALRLVRIERDEATQTALVDALAEWRARHLIAGEPPEVDESAECNRYLARVFPSPKGKAKPSRMASDLEVELMAELGKLRAISAAAEAREKLLSNRLLELAQGEALIVPGHLKGPYGTPQVSAGRRSVDIDALRREAPELVKRHASRGAPSASFKLYRFDQLRAGEPVHDEERDHVG